MRTVLLACLLYAGAAQAAPPADYTNPVYPGDLPDPSVIRIGKQYWSTATSSEWGPQFPILTSRDLVNWVQVGSVFTNPPSWAVANFWAPEIQEWKGRFYVYYVARQQGGPLSVGVATSLRPQGPYDDHGFMVAQDVGSIDPMAIDDENGHRYLVWKDDGNSKKQPTHLWAARLNEDGTRIVGDHVPLFRNELPWEGGVIEGPFVLKRGGFFYMFYSGNGCCGGGCSYALGVARARNLLGPWEKNPANPILAGNEDWLCPGHGSIVQDLQGRDWLMYHAYAAKGFPASGRQGLLDQVKWDADGWPRINNGNGPSSRAASPINSKQAFAASYRESFSGKQLQPGWNWPLPQMGPAATTVKGKLVLTVPEGNPSAILARAIPSGDFEASAAIIRSQLMEGSTAGIAAIGDRQNAAGLSLEGPRLVLWQVAQGRRQVLSEQQAPQTDPLLLRVTGKGGKNYGFSYSQNGRDWTQVGSSIEGGRMPPWDRAIRVGLIVEGNAGAKAAFDDFRMHPAGQNARK